MCRTIGFVALLFALAATIGTPGSANAGSRGAAKAARLRAQAARVLAHAEGSSKTRLYGAQLKAGRLYAAAYRAGREARDLERALRRFIDAAASAPRGRAALPLLERARLLLRYRTDKDEARGALEELRRAHPRSREGRIAAKLLRQTRRAAAKRLARRVLAIRDESGPESGRLVLELDGALDEIPAPLAMADWARVRLRLDRLRASAELLETAKASGAVLTRYRLDRFGRGLMLDARVTVPVQARVFYLRSPHRLVIDLAPAESAPAERASPAPRLTRRRARGLRSILRRVVLDPGHGGRDPGALGTRTRLREKDVTLRIAKRLAKLLRRVGVETSLTREGDATLELSERTAFANERRADLFVSIHVNSNPRPERHGLETYYLDTTRDAYAQRLAARENRASAAGVNDLDFILADLNQRTNVRASMRLAGEVLNAAVQHLGGRFDEIVGHGAKPALFHVLLGAKMPAILVETSYLTNARDERRLRTGDYLQRLAEGIFLGIRRYALGAPVANLLR